MPILEQEPTRSGNDETAKSLALRYDYSVITVGSRRESGRYTTMDRLVLGIVMTMKINVNKIGDIVAICTQASR